MFFLLDSWNIANCDIKQRLHGLYILRWKEPSVRSITLEIFPKISMRQLCICLYFDRVSKMRWTLCCIKCDTGKCIKLITVESFSTHTDCYSGKRIWRPPTDLSCKLHDYLVSIHEIQIRHAKALWVLRRLHQDSHSVQYSPSLSG